MNNNNFIKLLQAKRQTTLWLWWGRLSPIFFLVGAFGLYEIFNAKVSFLFYASWVIFITCSLIWWGWVLKIILDFINLFGEIGNVVGELQVDVREVQKDVKIIGQQSTK